MQKIIPNLRFDGDAMDAARRYVSTFADSSIVETSHYTEVIPENHDQSEDQIETIGFKIEGLQFTALNVDPRSAPTPANSFFVQCESEDEIDRLYEQLSTNGTVLIPLDSYPRSEKYCWVKDEYGVSWQFNLSIRTEQKISPFLLFTGEHHGKAETAIEYYSSLFDESGVHKFDRYDGDENEVDGTVKFAMFSLADQTFMAADSNHDHGFTFNESISFSINCESQDEIDHYRKALSTNSTADQSGWLKDEYGVLWQLNPR